MMGGNDRGVYLDSRAYLEEGRKWKKGGADKRGEKEVMIGEVDKRGEKERWRDG